MAGQLKEVRIRMQAVKSTQQITKAMKLVAASKLRRAQDRIIKMRPYANKLYSILGNIASGGLGDVDMGYTKERPVEKVLIILLTSDRGLCGGFNATVAKLVRGLLNHKYAAQRDNGNITILNIGKKGYEAMKKEKGITFITDYMNLFVELTFEGVSKVAERVMEDFEKHQFDVVEVVYNQFKNQITQLPTVEQFLPIQKLHPGPTTSANTANDNMNNDFIYQPSQKEIIEELVPKILKTQFYRYLLDSNASEHGARMTSMDKATDNAEELLKALSIQYNRVRQAAITTELTEIAGGVSALQG
jgi:F-type H+-transporting ATPase subunit gamma